LDIFFIDFRDPIFGLVVLVATVLVIAIFSYIWGVFKSNDEKNEISNFLKKFDKSGGLSENNKKILQSETVDTATLCFLAGAFSKSGYFEKAISIYLIALSKTNDKKQKEQIFTDLGQVYLKAGFIERAKNVFLEALKISARNQTALKFLTITCEKLKDYKTALESLDALMELGINVKSAVAYEKAMIILSQKDKSINQKVDEILELSVDFPALTRMCFEYFIKSGADLNEFKSFPPLNQVVDIMYYQNKALNLGDEAYKSLFFIKGLNAEDGNVSLGFEFDVLKNLNKTNFCNATISFKYVCKNCHNALPIHFYRCPVCNELGSGKIIPNITEASDENSMSF